jgi:DHA1 family tetracycline resistance protein-like MFS transporter
MKKFISQNPLPVVLFTIFIDMLGYGILIPIIPLLLADPNSKEYLLPLGYSVKQGYILLGFLTAIFPLMQFFATPILGQLSDKYGRKKLLGFSLAGTCISYVLFAMGIFTKNIPLLFIARAFDGITGGNIAVAQAAIADITKPENRTKNFGLMGAAFGFGFIIGPFLGGKLSDPSLVSWFNAATPFLFAAVLSLANVLSVIFFFPETLKPGKEMQKMSWNQSVLNIIKAFNMKGLRVIYTSVFLYNAGFTFYTTFSSVFLITRYNFTQSSIGNYFAFVGIWIAITQGFITRKVSGKFSEQQVLNISLLMTGLIILAYLNTRQPWQIYKVAPFFAIFVGLSMANITSLISRSVGPEIQGEILGINASIQAFAQTLPPMLSGFIAAKLTPTAPLWVSGLVTISAGLIYILLFKPTQKIIHQN